jgi:hypothetical protein
MNDSRDFEVLAEDMLEPGLYRKVLDEFDKLAGKAGASVNLIGQRAWAQLTEEQQRHQWPHVLGAYVRVVMDEENDRLAERNARDLTKNYADSDDVTSLSDSLFAVEKLLGHGIELTVEVDAQALSNVVAEVELLQHRVAMLRQQVGGDQ